MSSQNMDTSGNDVISELLDVNKLRYQMSSDLSVATSRRFAKQFPTSSSYGSANRTAIFVLQTGASAIGECYLHGSVTIDPGNTVPASDVSIVQASDIIMNAVCFSRDGVELQRINGVNLLARQLTNYRSSSDKQNGFNTMFRYGMQTFASGALTKNFVIPLSLILPMFEYTEKTSVFPSVLAAGMRIELQLASPDECFKTEGPTGSQNTPVTYELSNLYIQCECFSLTDSINLKLADLSSSQGLEIVVPDYHTSIFQTPSDSYTMEIRKAVSRALGVIAVPRETSIVASTDSLGSSQPLPFSTISTRLGNIYMPNSELSTKVEMFYHTLKNFEHDFQRSGSSSVNIEDFLSDGIGIFAQQLERSSLENFSMSGVSTNNSRTLMLQGKFDSPVATRNITCYLKHVAVIRSFLTNTVKEI